MQKFTIRPVVLQHKANTKGIVSIRIAVTVNAKVTYQATEHRIHKLQWDEKARAVINHENAALINISLRRKVADMERELIGMNMEGTPLTPKAIKGQQIGDRTFASFAEEIREDAKEINRLKTFAGNDLMLSDIDVAFLRKYEAHEKRRGMANNTINTEFRYLRRILNQAQREKLIKENPFDNFQMVRYTQTERIYLTAEELEEVKKAAKKTTGGVRVTAYHFLLGCYSGIRHSDWCRFNYDTMVDGEFLKLRPHKTRGSSGKWVVLPIGNSLKEIIEEIKDMPRPASNQKCNVMLKAIGSLANLNKELTTHVARHSFGYMCASNKIPKSVTAELMGVSTQTVEVYYHLSGENIIQQAAVLKSL